MMDTKTAKKQLQAAKEELEMVKVNAAESCTMDLSTVETTDWDNLLTQQAQLKAKTSRKTRDISSAPKRSHDASRVLADKSNLIGKDDNEQAPKRPRGVPPKASSRSEAGPKTPGLGEAATVQGDDTAECKQS